MTEIILFPDAVALTIDYLLDQFSDLGETATVHADVPDPRPARFVRVLRTGGVLRTLVTDGAQLTIEAWATTEADAHDLIQFVRALVHAMQGVILDDRTVYGIVEFAGPGLLPDPLSNMARYTFTVQVSFRGVAYGALSS